MNPEINWNRDWPAPAKLNLFLHVVGRRDDGYHLLQTVFRFIDVADSLCFTPRSDGEIVMATPLADVPPATDLTVRAAQALRRASGSDHGVNIFLTKRLPMGGGLGGGSSDAATTLIALNRLWNTGLSSTRLQQIGLTLGADVPVFIHGRSTFAEGIGEKFTDVQTEDAWYLVLVPPVAVPTQAIFASALLRRDTPSIVPSAWYPGFGANDLQPVACKLYPAVAEHLEWLGQHGAARMSGSGACCFVELNSEAEAKRARAAIPTGMNGFVARGLAAHPLLDLT